MATYWVKTSGSDSNDGSSFALAKATVPAGVALMAGYEDLIVCDEGSPYDIGSGVAMSIGRDMGIHGADASGNVGQGYPELRVTASAVDTPVIPTDRGVISSIRLNGNGLANMGTQSAWHVYDTEAYNFTDTAFSEANRIIDSQYIERCYTHDNTNCVGMKIDNSAVDCVSVDDGRGFYVNLGAAVNCLAVGSTEKGFTSDNGYGVGNCIRCVAYQCTEGFRVSVGRFSGCVAVESAGTGFWMQVGSAVDCVAWNNTVADYGSELAFAPAAYGSNAASTCFGKNLVVADPKFTNLTATAPFDLSVASDSPLLENATSFAPWHPLSVPTGMAGFHTGHATAYSAGPPPTIVIPYQVP